MVVKFTILMKACSIASAESGSPFSEPIQLYTILKYLLSICLVQYPFQDRNEVSQALALKGLIM
jgi:hypothetical protein